MVREVPRNLSDEGGRGMRNEFEVRGNITAIFLKRKSGIVLETLIDTMDLERAHEFPYTWYPQWSDITKSFYVIGHSYEKGMAQTTVRLYRWITNAKDNDIVDHINHNTLDNRRCNLRITNKKTNSQNRKSANKNSQSGVRGVHYNKQFKLWRAVVCLNGKNKHVGYFKELEEAERAVIEARREHYGA